MSNLRTRIALLVPLSLLVGASMLLAGCQGIERLRPVLAGAELLGVAYLTPASVTVTEQPPAATITTAATTPTTTTTTTTAATIEIETAGSVTVPTADAAVPYAANRPISITIAAIDLDAPVVPMGWQLAVVGGSVTTRWIVPLDAIGWAVNSAGTGDTGNVVLVGHQALGAGLLRSLALGEVEVGQEILVTAADGITYAYKVSEESPPIPAIGATDAENAQAAAYLAQADTAKLTLVTGWPADTSTHRVFIVADFVGTRP